VFEQQFAWTDPVTAPPAPALPSRAKSFCDRVVDLLGGG
jgi:hypothetical protein